MRSLTQWVGIRGRCLRFRSSALVSLEPRIVAVNAAPVDVPVWPIPIFLNNPLCAFALTLTCSLVRPPLDPFRKRCIPALIVSPSSVARLRAFAQATNEMMWRHHQIPDHKRERGGVAKRHEQELPLAQAADNLRSSSMDERSALLFPSPCPRRGLGRGEVPGSRTRVKH